MGYSDSDSDVRVDFFRVSENGHIGKWYTTEAVKWTGEWDSNKQLIHDAFKKSLRDHFKQRRRLGGMVAVCLEPYHEHSHPITIHVDDIWKDES